MRNYIVGLFCGILLFSGLPMNVLGASEEADTVSIGIQAPHAILMEASTGEILYEKDAHVAVPPASVTKIMTMLLIFEALEDDKIKLEDTVVVSERAASINIAWGA